MKLSLMCPTLPCAALMSLVLTVPAVGQSGGRAAAPTFAAPAPFSAAGQPIAAAGFPTGVTACSPCAQPTVALSPVQPTVAFSPVQPAVAFSPVQPTVALSPVAVEQPVVLQAFRPSRPLFTGRILRRIFGFRDRTVPLAPVAPTFVTTAYQPTFANAVFTPQVQTVARPVALATTTFRPVTLSAVGACPSCCSSCGVTQASFASPGCPNCAAGATTFSSPALPQSTPVAVPPATPTPAAGLPGETPQPGIAPNANVPQQRLRPLPPGSDLLDPNDIGPASPGADGSGSKSDAYWQPPRLYNPNARTTSRPAPAPVWNAVYQQGGSASAVSGRVYRVGPEAATSPSAPQRRKASAGVWHSVRD